MFMREGVEIAKIQKFEDVAQLCNLLPLDNAPLLSLPLDDLPQHLCDTNSAQENKVIHRLVGGGKGMGVKFYEHAMHILIK